MTDRWISIRQVGIFSGGQYKVILWKNHNRDPMMLLLITMYQTSLQQFLELFMRSMDESEKASLSSKRVANIIQTMTYITYRYINRGLYE